MAQRKQMNMMGATGAGNPWSLARLGLGSVDYKTFLKLLKQGGDKFPFAWKKILHIFSETQDLWELMQPETPIPQPSVISQASQPNIPDFARHLQTYSASNITIDDETSSLEQELSGKLKGLRDNKGHDDHSIGAMGAGDLLRNIFAFLQANPQLMALILSLLGVQPATV